MNHGAVMRAMRGIEARRREAAGSETLLRRPGRLAPAPPEYTKAALRLVVVKNPGLTARELAALTGWPPAKLATRLNALVADGEVVRVNKRRCGCSGCMAWTWEEGQIADGQMARYGNG